MEIIQIIISIVVQLVLGVALGLFILSRLFKQRYYFYHITYYRVSNGAMQGVSMGHVFDDWYKMTPLVAYQKVKSIAEEGCPSDSTWSIDLVQRNK